jgi:hypothetical protein
MRRNNRRLAHRHVCGDDLPDVRAEVLFSVKALEHELNCTVCAGSTKAFCIREPRGLEEGPAVPVAE